MGEVERLKIHKLKKTPKKQSNQEQLQQLEEEQDVWGVRTFIFYLAILGGLLLSFNPATNLVLGFLATLSMKKYNRAIQDLGRMQHIEDCQRIGQSLTKLFSPQQALIYSSLEDERLQLEKIAIDYLLTLSPQQTFAISVRSILPKSGEDGQPRVYFDANKNKIGYRKTIKSGKKYFNIDPIESLKEGTQHISENSPELVPASPVHIVVIAEPSLVTLHKDAPTQQMGAEIYLCIDNVYVVGEKDLIPLLNALEKKRGGKT